VTFKKKKKPNVLRFLPYYVLQNKLIFIVESSFVRRKKVFQENIDCDCSRVYNTCGYVGKKPYGHTDQFWILENHGEQNEIWQYKSRKTSR